MSTDQVSDEELAEAAVFLALVPERHAMPSELERKVVSQGCAAIAELRATPFQTTTRAGALELDREPARPRRASIREWAVWMVAAACFGLAVFQWRVSSLEHERQLKFVAMHSELRAEDGVAHASAVWSQQTHSGSVIVHGLPTTAHYRVWLQREPLEPVSVGAFECAQGCEGLEVPLVAATPIEAPRGVYVSPAGSNAKVVVRGSFLSAP